MIVGLVGCSAIISRNVPNHSLQEINIPTAQCGMCVARIDKALNGVDGILKYKVELDVLKVKVKYDNEKMWASLIVFLSDFEHGVQFYVFDLLRCFDVLSFF